MPLTTPVSREPLHHRSIDMRGFRRSDGLYDIEGRITDIRSYDFSPEKGRTVKADTPLHDMWVRLLIDLEMQIHAVEAVTDASPFPECPAAAPNLQVLKGVNLGKGWRKAISEKLAGTDGCTHLKELLNTIGSAVYQTMAPIRRARVAQSAESAEDAAPQHGARPPMIDSCYALSSERTVVLRKWPAFHTGKAKAS